MNFFDELGRLCGAMVLLVIRVIVLIAFVLVAYCCLNWMQMAFEHVQYHWFYDPIDLSLITVAAKFLLYGSLVILGLRILRTFLDPPAAPPSAAARLKVKSVVAGKSARA